MGEERPCTDKKTKEEKGRDVKKERMIKGT